MEAFGNVFAEAAICGVPAIGCLENGPEIIIIHSETGLLVPPRDVDALADAIKFFLQNPEKAKTMGKQAKEHIKSFTWERTASIYMDVIQQIKQ
jgi:glycosyltransferase involved in cell wall biosynthesis